MATAVIIASAAAEFTVDKGNLADNQLLIRTGPAVEVEGESIGGPFVPDRTAADLAKLEAQVAALTAVFYEPQELKFELALDPRMEPDSTFGGRTTVTLAEFTDLGGIMGYRDLTLLYVATPEILAKYGLDEAAIDPSVEVFTVETGEIRFVGMPSEPGDRRPELVTNFEQLAPTYSSLPGSFITPEAVRQRGWETAPVGWLIEATTPLADEQIAAARQMAAEAGLTVESRDYQEGLLALRSNATAVGVVIALGVLAMTVGLIRSEAAGDLRTLTATGATSQIRRMLTAVTAGTLALLGALLGTAGAYVALIAGFISDMSGLSHVPLLNLLLIVVGIPLLAALAGWLIAGREPRTLARQAIE
jgi:putative ABC transport system permease protein